MADSRTCIRCVDDRNSWGSITDTFALSKSPFEDELEFCSFCGYSPTRKELEDLLEISQNRLAETQTHASNVKAL